MDQKLQGFFNVTQRGAEEHKAEMQKRAEKARRVQALEQQVGEELGGILEILKRLPPKDGKQFFVTMHEQPKDDKEPSGRRLYIFYGAKAPTSAFGSMYSPGIGMTLFPDDAGGVRSDIHQYSKLAPGSYSNMPNYVTFYREPGWEILRQQIGAGIASFAPERLQDINDAVTASAEPQADGSTIAVFSKPLRLKPTPAPETAPAPAGQRWWNKLGAKLHR